MEKRLLNRTELSHETIITTPLVLNQMSTRHRIFSIQEVASFLSNQHARAGDEEE